MVIWDWLEPHVRQAAWKVVAEGLAVDWGLIAVFAAIGVAGSLVGNRLSTRVPQAALKRRFAVILLVMGAFILYQEAPGALGLARL